MSQDVAACHVKKNLCLSLGGEGGGLAFPREVRQLLRRLLWQQARPPSNIQQHEALGAAPLSVFYCRLRDCGCGWNDNMAIWKRSPGLWELVLLDGT
jgi:hypothetical protein